MATNLDTLQIEIKANATDAAQAIQTLVDSLKNLNAQLGLKDGAKLTTLLKTLSGSASTFSGVMDNISSSGLDKVVASANTATKAVTTLKVQAEELQKALNGASFSKRAILGQDANVGNLVPKNFGWISDIEVKSAAERLKQEFNDSLEGFHTFELNPEPIETTATIVEQKLLPALIDTQNQADNLYKSMFNLSGVEAVYDALMRKFVEYKTQMMETSGAIGGDKWIADSGTTALVTADHLKKAEEEAKKLAAEFDNFKANSLKEPFKDIEEGVNKAKSAIEQALEDLKNYRKTISDMENGNVDFNEDGYKQAILGAKHASKEVENFKKAIEGGEQPSYLGEVASRILMLSEALEKLSGEFGEIAEKGISVFKFMTIPLKHVAEEYREKFEHMKDTITGFQKHFQKSMQKISQFWKRTMKTFTFMLVRKAITAIIKEVGNAIQSLAMYSNAMGTMFNTDISNMVADFQYLGRSIVSVFAPLLNYITPIIDAIVSKIATLLSYIGMLFAALGGGTSFTRAKKNVENYAESLDSASKSAKNLTMGIDELNILNDSKSGGGSNPYDGWEDAWEEVEIPDFILNMADKLKKIFSDLFEPLKRAWNLAKGYVLDGWKFMTTQMKKLLGDVWRDFLKVWQSDTVVHTFYNLLMILGDIERVIGFIAKRFDEAWNEGEKGYRILKNIADIVDILVQHARNVSLYMIKWASDLDFNPLLSSIISLTNGLKDFADFFGGLFEDIMKNVVLEFIAFMIEEGIPHLYKTFAMILGVFDGEQLREKLVPIEEAFTHLLENIDIGSTNAIGNLGVQLALFTESEEFQRFLDTIEHMMNAIDAEDVEKILTGLGTGIGRIADALVKFVGSDSFNAFIDDIDNWLANASAEDIADIMERLAIAIGAFKFAEFATAGFAGFLAFTGIIKSFAEIKEIATTLGAVAETMGVTSGAASTLGGSLSGLASAAAPVVAIVAAIVVVIYSLIQSFGGLDGLMMEIRKRFSEIKDVAVKFAEAIGFDKTIDKLKDAFDRLLKKLGDLKDFWDVILDVLQFVVDAFIMVIELAIMPFIDFISEAINWCATFIDVLGGLGTMLKSIGQGITTGDWSAAWEGFTEGAGRIKDAFLEQLSPTHEEVTSKASSGLIEGFNNLPDAVSGDVSTAMKRIAGQQANDYSGEIAALEGIMKDRNTEAINEAILGTDYKSASALFSAMNLESLKGSVSEEDYASLSDILNGKLGESILNDKGEFESANAETATSGAESFNTEFLNFFTNNKDITTTMNTYGKDAVDAFNKGMEEALSSQTVSKVVQTIFKQINETSKQQIDVLKGNLATNISLMISSINFSSSIDALFRRIKEQINTLISDYGNEMQTILTTFMDSYITPFFTLERWQPLLDMLHNEAFVPAFDYFRVWFTEEAMTTWWEEDLLFWFAADKWDEEIFKPLGENIQDHWDSFSEWWDNTMTSWWENQVIPWFDKVKWTEQFNHILEVAKKTFDEVREAIKKRMQETEEAVINSCNAMKDAIAEVIAMIGDLIDSLSGLEGMEVNFKTSVSGEPVKQFATGGFPAYGSLFMAGEPGARTEWVGNVGGRTGVVSNGEITGIAEAVYSTGSSEYELLSQLITIGRQMLDKDPVVIGDRDIAQMATSGQSKIGMNIIS